LAGGEATAPRKNGGHRPESVASEAHSEERSATPQSAKPDTEAQRLVLAMRAGKTQELDALHSFIKANPDKADEVDAAISSHLAGSMQLYVRRMLEARRTRDNPSPARVAGSPRTSPRPDSLPVINGPAGRALPRKSLAPRPSTIALDKTAPIDDQLAHFKNVFARSAVSASQSPVMDRASNGHGGAPLRERAAPNADSSID